MGFDDLDPGAPDWAVLRDFFQAYLVPGFAEAWGDMWGATRHWHEHSSPEEIREAVGEIDRLLAGFSDEESLRRAVDTIGPMYVPTYDGLTYRQWLQELRSFIEDDPS